MKNNTTTTNCLICDHQTTTFQVPHQTVTYHHCERCDVIFKDVTSRVSKKEELERYETHENTPKNKGYIEYMDAFIDAHITPLKELSHILDFGSGPYPMLTKRLEERGYLVQHYDPYFHKDETYQEHRYDLIVLVEVLEHIFDPIKTLNELKRLLQPNGYLLIQTRFRNMDLAGFATWWYKRDETHVVFYNIKTFTTLANMFGFDIIKTNHHDIILLQHK